MLRLSRVTVSVALASALAAQAPGLRLFQSIDLNETQMVDVLGNVVHRWPGLGNFTAHMAADGTMVRAVRTGFNFGAGGESGRIQRLAFDGTVLWDYTINGPLQYAHHAIEPMPNGNVLVIVWEVLTAAQAIAEGRDPALLAGATFMPDAILELQPTGLTTATVVWEWHMMDHVIQDFDPSKPNYGVVANHPELLDINYPPTTIPTGDWNHINGIDYDPINDWIILSPRLQNEIWIIDHSTTTAEAAGHTGGARGKGGDFLYRWGNPEAYRAGTAANRQLFYQHDPRFVPPGSPGAGNVTVFNNDYLPNQSAVHELVLPLDPAGNFVLDPVTGRYGPTAPIWTFTGPGFHSPYVSGCERLPNGNTLVCSGNQNGLFEVTPGGQIVWSYYVPNSTWVFQCEYVARSLWADTTTLSEGGGQVHFDHLAGSSAAGRVCMLLGSVSGTAPGLPIPAGPTLPLNHDFLVDAMATTFNTGIFVNTLEVLDGNGHLASSIVAPPGFFPPGLSGLRVDFAHLLFSPSLQPLRASNPVPLTIVQ